MSAPLITVTVCWCPMLRPSCHSRSGILSCRSHSELFQVTEAAALAALHLLCLSTSPDIRIGFNSLCAHASVNHMHWHVYYQAHRWAYHKMVNGGHVSHNMCEKTLQGCSSWVESKEPGRPITHLGTGSISRPGATSSHILHFHGWCHPISWQGWCFLVPSRNSKALSGVAQHLSKYNDIIL